MKDWTKNMTLNGGGGGEGGGEEEEETEILKQQINLIRQNHLGWEE